MWLRGYIDILPIKLDGYYQIYTETSPVDVYMSICLQCETPATTAISYRVSGGRGVRNRSSTATHACETRTSMIPPGVSQPSSCGNGPVDPVDSVWLHRQTWRFLGALPVYASIWVAATTVRNRHDAVALPSRDMCYLHLIPQRGFHFQGQVSDSH